MSQTEGLHKGMVIRHEGQLYTVLDYHSIQKGKQRPTVHVKLRTVTTQRHNTDQKRLPLVWCKILLFHIQAPAAFVLGG